MSKTVLYTVKSVIAAEHAAEFNEWYHKKHIPELVKLSGCERGRRFKIVEGEEKYQYIAVYEFKDRTSFLAYQASEGKKYLVGDFKKLFGDKAELKGAVWEQIYPE
jgi:hypothetical protein